VFINKNKLCRTQWSGNGLNSGQDNGHNGSIICLHIASIFQTAAYDVHMQSFVVLNLCEKIINNV
jgi:hypothetical protein